MKDEIYDIHHVRSVLNHLMKKRAIKPTTLSLSVGNSSTLVKDLMEKNDDVKLGTLNKLAKALGVTIDAFLSKNATTDIVDISKVLFLGKVAAGIWTEQSNLDGEDTEFVYYDRIATDPPLSEMFAVEPEGSSMNLVFPAGFGKLRLICRRVPFNKVPLLSGQMVIVQRQAHDLTELTCKELQIAENGDVLLYPRSSDPRYKEPFVIKKSIDNEFHDGEITIIGVVERGVIDYRRE